MRFGNARSHASRLYRRFVPRPAGYEFTWQKLLETAKGETRRSGSLSRALAAMSGQPNDKNKDLIEAYGLRFLGQLVGCQREYLYENVIFETMLHTEIRRNIAPDTDNIIELGSGYGKNLFNIWLNGGPQNATYWALEYTASGRRCADYLASYESKIRLRSSRFDYLAPQLPRIKPSEKTFVFSSYSIEQIEQLPSRVFDMLLAVPGLYRVVHIEPVGWQRALGATAGEKERDLRRRFEESAAETHYNHNLLELIGQLASDGRIVVEEEKIDFLAHRPNLPGSVVVWRPKPSP